MKTHTDKLQKESMESFGRLGEIIMELLATKTTKEVIAGFDKDAPPVRESH